MSRRRIDRLPGGLADRYTRRGLLPPGTLKSELRRGIEVELEHTSDPRIAREIALDHLVEHPRYYTLLDRLRL